MTGKPFLTRGPARIFIDGEELQGGMDSMRWGGDGILVSEHDVKIEAEVEAPAAFEVDGWTPEKLRAAFEPPAEGEETIRLNDIKVRSGTLTLKGMRPSLWTRLYCALWWGHRPVRMDFFKGDFARDTLTCRCGKVTDNAESVERMLR